MLSGRCKDEAVSHGQRVPQTQGGCVEGLLHCEIDDAAALHGRRSLDRCLLAGLTEEHLEHLVD